MRLIFATWVLVGNDCYQGRVLNDYGAQHRLLSYWELQQDKAHAQLADYHVNGKSNFGAKRK